MKITCYCRQIQNQTLLIEREKLKSDWFFFSVFSVYRANKRSHTSFMNTAKAHASSSCVFCVCVAHTDSSTRLHQEHYINEDYFVKILLLMSN